MTSDPIQDAIELYRSGQSGKARTLLKQVIQQNPEDEAAWYWYVEMLPTLTAKIRALETFLQFVPENQKAIKALEAFKEQRIKLQTPLASDVPQQMEPEPHPEPSTTAAPYSHPKPSTDRKQSTTKTGKSRKGSLKKLWPAAVLVLGAAAFFLIRPLINTEPSPRELYAESMTPALAALEEWNEGPIMEWSIKLQSKDSWGISTYQEDIQDPVLRVIRRDELTAALVPLANQISNDGEAILLALESITPPEEIAEEHYQVILCVDYQIQKADATASFIQHDTISRLGENYCEEFQDAYQDIEMYITED
jgi:hypothetical protein